MIVIILLGQQYNVGEKPALLYCTLTLIAIQGHQTKQLRRSRRVLIFL